MSEDDNPTAEPCTGCGTRTTGVYAGRPMCGSCASIKGRIDDSPAGGSR